MKKAVWYLQVGPELGQKADRSPVLQVAVQILLEARLYQGSEVGHHAGSDGDLRQHVNLDRQIDRQIDRQTDRQIDRMTDRQIDGYIQIDIGKVGHHIDINRELAKLDIIRGAMEISGNLDKQIGRQIEMVTILGGNDLRQHVHLNNRVV